MTVQAGKKVIRPQFPIFRLIFQRSCDGYQCLIFVFSVIYLDSWGGDISSSYIEWGPRPSIWKVSFLFLFFLFFSSFSFLFFSFLFFSSFAFLVSFSGAPFSSGAPGHCPPMPPSRYATAPPPHDTALVNTLVATLSLLWFTLRVVANGGRNFQPDIHTQLKFEYPPKVQHK